MGILTLLAFALTRISKDGRREELVRAPAPGAAKAAPDAAPAPVHDEAPKADNKADNEADNEADNPWLQLL
jgi:hypothetical protein